MNEKNTKYLLDNFPNLYKNYGGDPRYTCMAWGFSCGDGWFNILKELSEKLEPLGVVAEQVKEKFGGLRFYVGAVNKDVWDEVANYIREAEARSVETCERCGESGENRGGLYGWITTLCEKCDEERSTI